MKKYLFVFIAILVCLISFGQTITVPSGVYTNGNQPDFQGNVRIQDTLGIKNLSLGGGTVNIISTDTLLPTGDTSVSSTLAIKTYIDNNSSSGVSGSIADNQVAIGSGTDTIEGSSALTFDGNNLYVNASSGNPLTIRFSDGVGVSESIWENNIGTDIFAINSFGDFGLTPLGSGTFYFNRAATSLRVGAGAGSVQSGTLSGTPFITLGQTTPSFANYSMIYSSGLILGTPTATTLRLAIANVPKVTISEGSATVTTMSMGTDAIPYKFAVYDNGGDDRYGIGMQSGQMNISSINTGMISIGHNIGAVHTSVLEVNNADSTVTLLADLKQKVYTDDVSNPPTDAELDAIYGTPAAVGDGFTSYIDDNNAGTNFYQVVAVGTAWFIFTGTKAL